MITRPMLAGKAGALATLVYPVLATPKLDGIRCLKINGRALTRSFKAIPNDYIRHWLEAHCPDGLDGEIIIQGAKQFGDTSSAVARSSGQPDFTYAVFDYVTNLRTPYINRMIDLAKLKLPDRCVKVVPQHIENVAQLTRYETKCLNDGFEGVMVRSPYSPYKCGRSTPAEGYLLKVKRWLDEEATILECIEEMANLNPAEKDAFGRTKRSLSLANRHGRGTLGALRVRSLASGWEFSIGAGFDQRTRDRLWSTRRTLIGKVIKFKHQPHGAKDAPRFPIFLGFRESWDMEGGAQ
jgi:DNA ligase-1